MGPPSPTHAFDPTPALEHDPDNFSPLNQPDSTAVPSDNNGSEDISRAVRFLEQSVSRPQGRHSIATDNVPLLPHVLSASQLPKYGFQITNTTSEIDITAYMEQCRLWNTQLRESHEAERKAWAIERTALKARIAELERKLNKARDPKRRSSNDSSTTAIHSFRSDFHYFGTDGTHRDRFASEPANAPSPVWKGPETTPPVTRVFTREEDVAHLPSISEDEPLESLSNEISPTSTRQENIPVPIEQVDNTLDGITLKSGALTSSFDTKITSPKFASPVQSPSAEPKQGADSLLQFDVKALLSPLDAKLKMHAGHTPMIFDGTLSSDVESADHLTPTQEQPLEPAPTKRPPLRPSENSDSYFSFTSAVNNEDDLSKQSIPEQPELEEQPTLEPEDDPALKGPLMLDPSAKTEGASTFLDIVDGKLEDELAHRSRQESNLSPSTEEKLPSEPPQGTQDAAQEEADEDMPRLRIRNSTNFGSAWGGDMPGRM
ncbi:hypothetical protein A1O3_07944 [Capronia epimyces CBS 606.96]|uniref:Uncharacterized protein n=1 Tax=Capronia epimyces CBS 606.96 TaxID=1182542 RepID=W9YBB6_9EURO|nr:uncharacterized protein A1O3_07944 [Capronia epimyces CBS 606.96]EXJ79664.1 hypothetical protein A1O3_07944 [Capronia epimyces CBS 606.96]